MVLLLVLMTLVVIFAIEATVYVHQRTQAKTLATGELTSSVYFHPGHTWISFQPNGEVKIGIDKFLREILGNFDEVIVPSKGRRIKQNQPLFTIIKNGKAVHFVSPIDGVVISHNSSMEDGKKSEYIRDHMLTFRPTNIRTNLRKMKNYQESEGWFRQEFARFVDFASVHMNPSGLGLTMADGGKYKKGIVEHMDTLVLESFNKEFLSAS